MGAGGPGGSGSTPGEIDHRLARHRLLSELRKGRLAKHEVCDAHPELLRAARNVGEATGQRCPGAKEATSCSVSYVFRAGHACGRGGA
jgi:hypothetical protein